MGINLDTIFRPSSVAVVGASATKGTLGREIFDKLLDTDFNGPVYPVNPKANYIHSVKAYTDLASIPGEVDLAVIVVPKQFVLQVVRDCADKGVKGLVVITAGFKETGEDGARQQAAMVDILRAHQMRMVGPNCMGVINTEPDIRLDTTFAPIVPMNGNVALASQSGALGQTILEHAHERDLGISMFVSVGNKADISGNDLLEYWHDEPTIEVILMYLESFGDPARFFRLAKEVSLRKTIVVVKSGRTSSGARAATSHTGALAGTDTAYDALFKQCGVVRADTINQMFDFAMGFSNLPLPAGRRVAIITNAGGPGIMAADACENHHLEVIELGQKTRQALRERLVQDASVENPVDLLAGAQPEEFQVALDLVLHDPAVDAVIVIFVAPVITSPPDVASKIAKAAAGFNKPVLGCFMGVQGVATGIEELHRHRIPAFAFPESAARTLAAMVDYKRWLSTAASPVPKIDCNKEQALQAIAGAQAAGRQLLTLAECLRVLQAYQVPFVKTAIVDTLDSLLAAAEEMDFPLVLKCTGEKIVHKSEFGAVKLNITDTEELRAAHAELLASLGRHNIKPAAVSLVLQEMLSGGKEVVSGVSRNSDLGPLVMFGLGGIYVEFLKDVTFRLAPLTDCDASNMMQEIRSYPILQGVRGEAPVAVDFARDVLLKLSQLSLDLPQIEEIDLNPIVLYPEPSRCAAVDVRIAIRSESVAS